MESSLVSHHTCVNSYNPVGLPSHYESFSCKGCVDNFCSFYSIFNPIHYQSKIQSDRKKTESSRYRFLLPPKLRKEGRQKVKGIPHNFLLLDYTSCYILRDPKEEPLRNSMQRYLQKICSKEFLRGSFRTI